ncbi:hypothetical protein R3P38DRAFT_3285511 [Favolaschia claudopus]|uniref:Uncharacterized protein n=1 Tax=Favolaschia claudopus TaxID=2862362 RepID=A0AAW0A4C8_9AGAR
MLFKVLFSLLALALSVKAVSRTHESDTALEVNPTQAPAEPGHVFTAVRAYKVLTDVSPFIVTKTTTFVWTQSPTTTIAEPTGSGI